MPTQRSFARSEPVACPICGRPLNWMPDRRLAEFDCGTCGPFSDFGGAALVSEQRHGAHPHKVGGSKSDDDRQDHEDENDSGGEGGGRA